MSTGLPLPVGELQPQSGHTRNGLNVVPAESGEEGEPGLYLHLPGKGRLERDVITFDWASKRLDKVTRQSERKGNKNPQMEFKTLKPANHRKLELTTSVGLSLLGFSLVSLVLFQFNVV